MTFLAVIFAAALLAVMTWRLRRYRRALRIPASRDDAFLFRNPLGTHRLVLAPDGFDWPAQIGMPDTALLEFTVNCTLRGRWQDPFIDIKCAGQHDRQYFERGACGRRYLNLSGAVLAGSRSDSARVQLSAHGLRWETGAILTTFSAPRVSDASLMVLAPHPDDAEIAAFGLYAGSRAWVVTITCGERSTTDLSAVGIEPSAQSAWLACLRVWDSLCIPQLGGIPAERCLNLAYPDTQLSAMRADPERRFQLACEPGRARASLRALNRSPDHQHGDSNCRWLDLVAELRALIDEQRPEFIVCPHPWLDAHPDHAASTAALAEALRTTRHRPAAFLLYSVHPHSTSLYPFGEPAGCVGLPPGRCPEPIADSIYLHPLDARLRLRKYFAIEAAHDLRSYHGAGRASAAVSLRRALRQVASIVSGMPLDPSNYLRRGARPNEIYFVVDEAGLARLATSPRP